MARQLYAAAASHGMKEAADRLRVVGPPAVTPQQDTGRSPAPPAGLSRCRPRRRPDQPTIKGWQPTAATAWASSFSVNGLLSLGALIWTPPGISA